MSLIDLEHVDKTYLLGDVTLPVLKDVSLSIERGEFVALMGVSGSGKTTLMNLLGCLDKSTAGTYRFEDRQVDRLDSEQLARLRSSRIGFVFQNFNLMPRAAALENVSLPSVYSPEKNSMRTIRERSRGLLKMLGLESRMDHTPAKLSGGEQQRVAIARALVNQPIMLLADEPTGNLDSRTGKEILDIFRRLNVEQRITILLVTHDMEVARSAHRIIRIADGRIIHGGRTPPVQPGPALAATAERNVTQLHGTRHGLRVATGAVRIALQALRRNVMRTLLTMLGVIIGVAAVIDMMEINRGASAAIQLTVANMGANTLMISPGAPKGGSVRYNTRADSLTPYDAEAMVRECPSLIAAAPIVNAWGHAVVYGNRYWRPIYITGSTEDYLKIRNWANLELGRMFTPREVAGGEKVCLIGKTLVRELFGSRYPIGEEVRVKNVPFKVIGVLNEKGADFLGADQDDILFAPWTSVKYRLNGQGAAASVARDNDHVPPGLTPAERLPGGGHAVRTENLEQIVAQARSMKMVPSACDEIARLLRDRHHVPADESAFRIYDNAEVSNAMKNVVQLLSGLALAVAAVSLVVGGVGIMNIMLVSVTERTREIGLRMAVGANPVDILFQFLIEAVVLCMVGGIIGILAGRGSSVIVSSFLGWPTRPSWDAAAISLAVSLTVGVSFGFYPAWKASRMNPIDALRYE